MNDECVVALLGLVLLTLEGNESRIPYEVVEKGLPENSAVRVFNDEENNELVIQVAEVDN